MDENFRLKPPVRVKNQVSRSGNASKTEFYTFTVYLGRGKIVQNSSKFLQILLKIYCQSRQRKGWQSGSGEVPKQRNVGVSSHLTICFIYVDIASIHLSLPIALYSLRSIGRSLVATQSNAG